MRVWVGGTGENTDDKRKKKSQKPLHFCAINERQLQTES